MAVTPVINPVFLIQSLNHCSAIGAQHQVAIIGPKSFLQKYNHYIQSPIPPGPMQEALTFIPSNYGEILWVVQFDARIPKFKSSL